MLTETRAPETLPTTRRLVRYDVRGLFGWREFSFELAGTGPTLLTGANGSGKSTILRTIHDTGIGAWPQLQRHAFTELELTFDDGRVLRVDRGDDGLRVGLGDSSWQFTPDKLTPVDLDEFSYGRERQIYRLGSGEYFFEGRSYQKRELELVLSVRQSLQHDGAMWVADIPKWFQVLFITDQRLIAPAEERSRYLAPSIYTTASIFGGGSAEVKRIVDQYARDLGTQMSRVLSGYAAASQNLDREFPRKIVDAMTAKTPEVVEVRRLMAQVQQKREALQAVGLLEGGAGVEWFDTQRFEEASVRPVIKIFAEDTLRKFATLDDMRARLELFLEFLNRHYERKRVTANARDGLVLLLEDPGRVLKPSELSSGEQQILVLAYQVLFERDPGTLVLIDEPELSLHVLWQASLVDDLTKMGRARGLSFILATHSPTLIADREDLQRSLD
jgi:energy-coupling factor transporter ATP-binding protein EcfA2